MTKSSGGPLAIAIGAVAVLGLVALSFVKAEPTGAPSSGITPPQALPGWPYQGGTLAELKSSSASPMQARNLQVMIDRVLVPLQPIYGVRATVRSGARNPDRNSEVSVSPTSGHLAGEALDLKVAGWSAYRLAEAIRGIDPAFDQIIAYATSRGGHVHIGNRITTPGTPRRMVMVAPAGSDAEIVDLATYAALQYDPDTKRIAA